MTKPSASESSPLSMSMPTPTHSRRLGKKRGAVAAGTAIALLVVAGTAIGLVASSSLTGGAGWTLLANSQCIAPCVPGSEDIMIPKAHGTSEYPVVSTRTRTMMSTMTMTMMRTRTKMRTNGAQWNRINEGRALFFLDSFGRESISAAGPCWICIWICICICICDRMNRRYPYSALRFRLESISKAGPRPHEIFASSLSALHSFATARSNKICDTESTGTLPTGSTTLIATIRNTPDTGRAPRSNRTSTRTWRTARRSPFTTRGGRATPCLRRPWIAPGTTFYPRAKSTDGPPFGTTRSTGTTPGSCPGEKWCRSTVRTWVTTFRMDRVIGIVSVSSERIRLSLMA
mmetsp:Transcript_22576/g.62825  ORF Transcript_22576/g.62825 Transcript_22576/m.62825 type:complete len:346 (+) Transcript_22576:274-1311(+)